MVPPSSPQVRSLFVIVDIFLITRSTETIASSKPTIALDAAISTAEKALDGKFNEHPATIEYLAKDDASVVLTHVIQIRNEAAGTWYQAFVDAHSGELVSVVDFVTQASVCSGSIFSSYTKFPSQYLVLPITSEILTQGFQTLTDPQDTTSSPSGWHSTGDTSTT